METVEYAPPMAEIVRQGMGEAFLVVNNEGAIRSASQAAEYLLGYEPGQLVNMSLAELGFFRRPIGLLYSAARPQTTQLVKRSGEQVSVTITATPLDSDAPGEYLLQLVRDDERI
ncbi:MAG: PAS domain-containing protein, partial [Chloroflexota bacterium]